ncbi:Rho guanine nucleotide exchange factor scd1 [Termitomyces sp. T112]|nr:Rho guanine nucleotide exchange factor scd1 [Termitomyces sp. T112]
MRSNLANSWLHRDSPAPSDHSPPPLISFTSFFRKQPRPPSLRSAHSSTTASSSSHSRPVHPFSPMPVAPLPVVSARHPVEVEAECPVCLEPLSFSFRLPGEKPHIVPECSHALHEACFTAVYGPPPNQARSTASRRTNLGVCGVCRRPMKVGDGDGGKLNKLAALTGMGPSKSASLFPGRDAPTNARAPSPYNPNDDDPLETTGSVRSGPNGDHYPYIIAPSIQVRPEFSSLTRSSDLNQPLTCIVVIELPGKRAAGSTPGPVMNDDFVRSTSSRSRQEPHSGRSSPHTDQLRKRQLQQQNGEHDPGSYQHHPSASDSYTQSPTPYDPNSYQHPSTASEVHGTSSTAHNSYIPNHAHHEEDSPFHAITEDLRNRIIDWKGHPLSDLGPLQMYDLLSVRRDTAVREFYVYLFREAIICVVEERKRGLGRLLSNASGFTDPGFSTSSSGQSKGVLRLKGRIYVRHIKHVTASSAAGEMSLTIDMEDELASFILIFRDRASMDAWKNNIQTLVNMFQQQNGISPPQPNPRVPDMEEFGGSQKALRVLSGGSTQTSMTPNKLTTLAEDDQLSAYSPTSLVTPYTSSGPSNSLTPLPHPPLDLILVISIPPPSAVPSTAQLKIRVIRTTLDFMLASMAKKDRLSLVTFEVGPSGRVRKTPFLSPGKPQSRARLEKFIDETGNRMEEQLDEFLVRGSKEEKTDVVTAVNHGLDVVLQRKARNPISGMVLVSDASDSTRRAQMDLVLARAEAANVPIHPFGYGRSHDPASLWLMSNHTSGTYTFVREWYDLRDCIAGCVGGMMSIGLLNMKMHIKVVDGHRFRIRKVSGGPSSILASDGQNVDIDVGELRYGERKEMLIEMELDNTDAQKAAQTRRPANPRAMNATDKFVQSMGLDSLSMEDSDFTDGMMDRMIDEVPIIEVDGAFFDPAAAKNITRLAHPVLLTVTLLPPSSSSKPPSAISDPVIVRRRMELLASDMITRALVLVSRRNFPQAQKIMGETKRILQTVLQTISRSLPPPNFNGNGNGSTVRNRRELLTLAAVRAMQAILQDLQTLLEALEDNVELFAHDQRNFGAQQAMILRDQKAWSGRSATERLFWTTDNSIELVSRSTDWVARD